MKKVTLTIAPNQDQRDYFDVAIYGEGFYQSVGVKVGARIVGVDEFFDDFLLSTDIKEVQFDGSFSFYQLVHKDVLDEDWGADEVKGIVDVGDDTYETNEVRSSF